jgi:host factor-I protein
MIKNQATVNIQDQFLNRVRRDRIRLTMELVNGRKIEGILVSFDNFSLLLRGESDQLIYKHAIVSLTVAGKLDFESTGAPSAAPTPRAGTKGTM